VQEKQLTVPRGADVDLDVSDAGTQGGLHRREGILRRRSVEPAVGDDLHNTVLPRSSVG
jgi:hypothetical protein